MAVAEDKVRLQTIVSKKVAEKVDFYAERFEVSQSKMVAMIVESCIEDDAVLLQICSSAAVKKIARALGSKKKNIQIELT